MRRFVVAVYLASLSSGSFAAEQPATRYRVQATLSDGAAVVGRPVLLVEAGRQAAIKIGDRTTHYTLRMTAVAQAEGVVRVSWDIDADSPTGGHRTANPVLTVMAGKPAGIAFGGHGTMTPLHLSFVIDPVLG